MKIDSSYLFGKINSARQRNKKVLASESSVTFIKDYKRRRAEKVISV